MYLPHIAVTVTVATVRQWVSAGISQLNSNSRNLAGQLEAALLPPPAGWVFQDVQEAGQARPLTSRKPLQTQGLGRRLSADSLCYSSVNGWEPRTPGPSEHSLVTEARQIPFNLLEKLFLQMLIKNT